MMFLTTYVLQNDIGTFVSEVVSEVSSEVSSDFPESSSDILTKLDSITSNQEMIIYILLFTLGVAVAVFVMYLLYSFIRRFINY